MQLRIPESKIAIISGAGHAVHLEEPKETAEVINKFIRELNMLIEKVRYELNQPIITSKAQIESRDGWIVALDEGENSGCGEILPLEGWSSVTMEEAYSQLVSYKHSEMSLPELSNEVQAAIALRSGILKHQRRANPL